jgi:hypothetical protein
MSLKKELKLLFFLFCIITTCECLFVGIFSLITSRDALFDAWFLIELPFIAFLSVLPTLILWRSETVPRVELIIRRALHFVLTAGIVCGLTIYIGWMDAVSTVVITMAFFLAVYIPVFFIAERRARSLARKINEKIDALRNDENAQHQEEP